MPLLTKTRFPGLSVILKKNVGRQKLTGAPASNVPLTDLAVSTRFSGQDSVLDVTEFIGEHGSVRVSKSVREEAGGFTIEFTDKIIQNSSDSIYGLFEPMDVVEIRMAANSWAYSSTQVPIMMRGFISRVRRSEAMGSDGRPVRKVTIIGLDYGKIWKIYNIYFNPWMPNAANYITDFKLFTRFGLAFQTQSAGSLVNGILQKILNPFIAAMSSSAAPLLQMKPDITVTGGNVAPFGVNDWQGGAVYYLLRSFCDVGPWNELFIEDRQDAPYLVYRPNPFIVAGGNVSQASSYINGNSTLPANNSIDRSDVVSIEVERTDANVANYYWVEQSQYDLNFGFVGKAMSLQGQTTFDITQYGNSASALYGFKRMAESTNQFGAGTIYSGGTPKAQNQKDANDSINWINQRRQKLIAQNQDNVIFESGSMRIVGNENVKAGTYLNVTHGNMTSSYYVEAVSHDFQPISGNYFTTVRFVRGTGFIDRVQQGSGPASPYWSELADAQKP